MPSDIVYLAGPIDFVKKDSGYDPSKWREEASYYLSSYGLGCYDPASAFKGPIADTRSVAAVNMAALAECGAVVAFVDESIPSWGTPIEIVQAASWGMPVALYRHSGSKLSAYIKHFETFDRLEDACNHAAVALDLSSRLRESLMTMETGGWEDDIARGIADAMGSMPRDELLPAKEDWLLATDYSIVPPAKEGDVGYDLITLEETIVPDRGWAMVPVGIGASLGVALPRGTWATVYGRSSLFSTGLVVIPTVIDNGYRGPIYTMVHNLSDGITVIKKGQRISQLVLHWSIVRPMENVGPEGLPPSQRGADGFGSTGK